MPHKTKKQVQSDLKVWGRFWAEKEKGSGYASISVTARICETLKTEVYTSSDLHLFSHSADAVYVPPYIEVISEAVDMLSIECRKAVRRRYINNEKFDDILINRAENSLIAFLS